MLFCSASDDVKSGIVFIHTQLHRQALSCLTGYMSQSCKQEFRVLKLSGHCIHLLISNIGTVPALLAAVQHCHCSMPLCVPSVYLSLSTNNIQHSDFATSCPTSSCSVSNSRKRPQSQILSLAWSSAERFQFQFQSLQGAPSPSGPARADPD